MTGNDIKEHLELYLSTTVDSEKVVLIINECLALIGDLVLCYDEIELSPGDGGWDQLPENTTAVVSVTLDGKAYDNWTSRGTSIHFGELGVFNAVIRRMANEIKSLNDSIDIHPLFKPALIFYTRGIWKIIEDDTSQDGHRLLEQFKEESLKAYNIIKRIRDRGV